MVILLGLFIIAIGSFGQSSSYVPINKIQNWSWETFWTTQGVFAWLVFPLLGTLLALPNGYSFDEVFMNQQAAICLGYGVLWGIGGLTFGLSMRYLGVSLGQSLSLGTCSAFGTLFPTIMAGISLFTSPGNVLFAGVVICLLGILIIGFAGQRRNIDQKSDDDNSESKYSLTKGVISALVAGVMSACFALGLDAGTPIKEYLISKGTTELFAGLPVVALITLGGLVTNLVYCFYLHQKNNSWKEYTNQKSKLLTQNILWGMLAGGLWYSQFFCLEIGKSFLSENALLLGFSWSILMILNVSFSNLWGVLLKEWKGVRNSTLAILVLGILILMSSIIIVSIA